MNADTMMKQSDVVLETQNYQPPSVEDVADGKLCLYYREQWGWDISTGFKVREYWSEDNMVAWLPLPYLPDPLQSN